MDERCRWCGQPAGEVPICSARCFQLTSWAGWFDGNVINRRKGRKLISATGASGEEKVGKVENKKFESKANECGLFPNTRRPEKSDVNGQIEIMCGCCGNASGYYVNGWRRETNAGLKYLKLRLTPKQQSGNAPSETQSNQDPF
jgi:hypothetical protein